MRPGSLRTLLGRWAVPALGAATLNLALLALLAGLNAGAVSRPVPREARLLHLAEPPREPPRQVREAPEPSRPDPPVVSLDAPALPSLRPAPVEVRAALPLSLPTPASVTFRGASGLVSEDRVDQPPRDPGVPPPRYPASAARRRAEGKVTVKLLIGTEGRVEQARLVGVAGDPTFGQAVLDAVVGWQFVPARHRGQPVKVWALKTVRFRIGKE
jgi:protein TonB